MSIDTIAPLIKADPDAPFWEAWTSDQRFLLHRCGICGRHDWPATCCQTHGMSAMEWVDTPGAGVIDTFTIFHRAYIKELASEVPYTVAVVRLDEGTRCRQKRDARVHPHGCWRRVSLVRAGVIGPHSIG